MDLPKDLIDLINDYLFPHKADLSYTKIKQLPETKEFFKGLVAGKQGDYLEFKRIEQLSIMGLSMQERDYACGLVYGNVMTGNVYAFNLLCGCVQAYFERIIFELLLCGKIETVKLLSNRISFNWNRILSQIIGSSISGEFLLPILLTFAKDDIVKYLIRHGKRSLFEKYILNLHVKGRLSVIRQLDECDLDECDQYILISMIMTIPYNPKK